MGNQIRKIIKYQQGLVIKSSIQIKMQNQNQDYFQEQNSWFDCIGDIPEKNIQKKFKTQNQIETENNTFQNNTVSFSENQNTQITKVPDQYKAEDIDSFKRVRQTLQVDQQYYTQNSSSNEIKSKASGDNSQLDKDGKNGHLGKQHIYSKNYRQRKKQHAKLLQQQNDFLKKKIRELQFRLRQMELEINRLKFMPEEKEYTIEMLNEQFMTKVTVIMEKNKQNPAEYRSKYEPSDPFYSEFMATYAQHGFGGSKKLQIMNYYYNEILEAMLRDSEKYFALMCLKAKDGDSIKGFPQYDLINAVFLDILKPDEDKLRRLRYFQVNLHPMVLEFVQACKQFNSKYNKILKSIQRIHQFMRLNYPSNFDFARMRIIELQSWFEKHKYIKMMRNLKAQWLEQVKTQVANGVDEKKNCGTKKKKVHHKEE